MNIRGIEFARHSGLPGPPKEQIFRMHEGVRLDRIVDLDKLYDGARRGAAIIVFDYSEPIDQNQSEYREKNIHAYPVPREEYFETLVQLSEQMLAKGVATDDVIFLTHQAYTAEDIAYSGKASVFVNRDHQGSFLIDAVESLRVADSGYHPSFVAGCPIRTHARFPEYRITQKYMDFPPSFIRRIFSDVRSIGFPLCPVVDFEIYKPDERGLNRIIYHDLVIGRT